MKSICIDIRMLENSGIGTYLQNLVPRIIRELLHYKIYLLFSSEKASEIFDKDRVTFVPFQSKIYTISEQIEFQIKIPKNLDLFWSPHFNIPYKCQAPLLVTIHDLFHLYGPNQKNIFLTKLYAKIMLERILKKSTQVISVSQFTKSQLVQFSNAFEEKTTCIYNGIQENWFHLKKKSSPLNKPFFLFVGNIKPHKNIKCLMVAFEKIMNLTSHHLVIAGQAEGLRNSDQEIYEHAKKLGSRVHFIGKISQDLLEQYYLFAEALIFPSLYEGFGLPGIEAMACGTPLIASDIPVFHEIYGESCLYFHPEDPETLASQLLDITRDLNKRGNLSSLGQLQARQYSWEKTAQQTLSILENILT